MLKQFKKSMPEVGPGSTGSAPVAGIDWFEKFFTLSQEALCISNVDGYFKHVNKAFSDVLGYSADELYSTPYIEFIHPDDRQRSVDAVNQVGEGNSIKDYENRYCCRNGEIKWLSWSTTFLDDGMVLASARDVTQKKKSEETLLQKTAELNTAHLELNEALERYKLFVQQSSEIIWRCELPSPVNIHEAAELQVVQLFQGFLAECNDQMAHFYGYSAASEMIGKQVADFFDPQEPVTRQIVREFVEQGYKIHRRLSMHIDHLGNERFFLNNLVGVVEDGRLLRVWTTQTEITEQRKARLAARESEERFRYMGTIMDHDRKITEEALRMSEERYRSVVHALGEGIVIHDKNGDVIACNRSAEAILGHEGALLIRQPGAAGECIHEDGSIFPPEEHPSFITLKTGSSFQNVVMGVKRSDGLLIWISVNTEPVYYTQQRMQPDAAVASFVDITQKKAAETELRLSQQQLKEYSERITNILASITDGFIAVDKKLHITLWNHAVERITGLKAGHVIGTHIEKIFPNFTSTAEFQQYSNAINKGLTANFEHYIPAFKRWLETSVYPFSQGGFIYFRDITERKKQELLLKLEKEVLKINAHPVASLKATVDYFLEGLEKAFPDMMCSVVMLEDDKKTIRHLSAPSLPEEYALSINGKEIGPVAGSCGTAIFRKQKVLTVDTATDPLWAQLQPVAIRFGLGSCWSFPIVDAQENVLATIATYHRYPKEPTAEELNIFDRVSNLLRVIIENKNAESKIRISNERYLLVTKATNDAIWDWDVHTNSLYWGEGIYSLFGYKPGYVDNSLKFWEASLHEEDRERVINGLNQFISDNNLHIWEDEYRFKKANGEYALVYDRGFLIFDHTARITRMVGSMQDITEKKEMERRLLKQELDKQKLVAQAVVNAQEKERAEIGKELHDNVNQILSTAKLYLELAQTDDEGRIDLISRSADNISDAINEIRGITRSLVPPSVGDLGLIDSIQDLVENIKATKKLNVEFYSAGAVDSLLDEKRKLMLFRIVQEQVNNVLKHAMAYNLVIELIADDEGHTIDLTISDDGKGFEPEKLRTKKGVGLSNISSRAQLFNGSVNIVSAIGQGCKLKINVPISNI